MAQPAIESKKQGEAELDIDEWEKRPAFVRRNIKFVKDSSSDGTRSRVVLKDETPTDHNSGQNGSLF